jgi:hypothetical protein
MQSAHGADEPATKKRRMEGEGREENPIRQRIYDHSTVSDNARAQFGDQYHSYHGPVYVNANATSTAPLTEYKWRNITDALKFHSMDMRRATVKLPSGNTCEWFFDSPEYRKWRDVSMFAEHHGFLWIRGKPGAGKSTLMRLAVKHADQDFSNDLRISFFFNAKGTSLERSIEGMYRTLLYQMLVQCPRLEAVLHKRPWNHMTWPTELLEEHFRDCVLQLGARELTCHIDALDECEESDVRSLIEFFEDLGSVAVSANIQMHVCFASRHYPRISISRCVDVVLDNLKGHQEDIETYVRNNLKVPELALRDQLAEDIRARARDVFLWVVLVVRLLNRENDRGNGDGLRAQLNGIPRALHDLFENAINERGIADSRNFLPTLLWILFARRPLSPLELYHAVLYARNDIIDISGAMELDRTPDPNQVERFILNTSKGLAEITVSEHENSQPRVQFIHETVREHLQNNGISRLENSFCSNPTGISHDFLKSRCADYMSRTASFIRQMEESKICELHSVKGTEDFQNAHPFLEYAAKGLVTHAELAQAHGVPQVFFLDAFPLDLVIKLSKLTPDKYYTSATQTYMFASLHAPRLLQLELDRVKHGGEHRPRPGAGVVSTANRVASLNSVQGIWGTPLNAAIVSNIVSSVQVLLEHGSDVNSRGETLGAALTVAAMNNPNLNIIELLFRYGADVTARGDGQTALQLAVTWSNVDTVRIFLAYGADVNAPGGREGSALHRACRRGSLDAVRCLVEHGANVNAKGGKTGYDTALQAARKCGHQEIVDYLLEHGAREDDDGT